MKTVIVTGAAGFIGSALVDRLLHNGETVVAIDFLPPSTERDSFLSCLHIHQVDVCDRHAMTEILQRYQPDVLVHLAGRTGVVASIESPDSFFKANVDGTQSVLEACRVSGVSHVIISSSVVVYGSSIHPVREDALLPSPANPYAATKRAAELFSETYSATYGLNVTVLRIFSVFGPGQKKETAVYKFAENISEGKPVIVYGDGSACRDYLFLDDCVDGIINAISRPFRFEIINLGEAKTATLLELVDSLEKCFEKKARIENIVTPKGVLDATCADIMKARSLLEFEPKTHFAEGIRRFVKWYEGVKEQEEDHL